MPVTTMKTVAEFSFTSHGCMYPDYFQGAGVSFSRYEDCYTGCGSTERDAADDAIEQMCEDGYSTNNEIEAELLKANDADQAPDNCLYYVTIFIVREPQMA